MTTWTQIKSKSTRNLHVLSIDGKEVGFICRPDNSATDKNAWRCHFGIGEGNRFLGHRFSKKSAMICVELEVQHMVARPVIVASGALKAKMQRLSQRPPVSFDKARTQTQTALRMALSSNPSSGR